MLLLQGTHLLMLHRLLDIACRNCCLPMPIQLVTSRILNGNMTRMDPLL